MPTKTPAKDKYNALLTECGEFDRETKALLRQREIDQRKFFEDRKIARDSLLKKKGEAFIEIQSAGEDQSPTEVVPAGGTGDSPPQIPDGTVPEGWEPPGVTTEQRPLWLAATPEQRQAEFERWQRNEDGSYTLKAGEEEDDDGGTPEEPTFMGYQLSEFEGKTDAEILAMDRVGEATLTKVRAALAERDAGE